MTLSFPNASRSYDPAKQCVRFRGYDSVFEIAFHLDEAALQKISPYTPADESSLLAVFDLHRDRINRIALIAYKLRRRQSLHRLSAADF